MSIDSIEDTNLSRAWARAFLRVRQAPSREVAPMVVTVRCGNDCEIIEDRAIREALDRLLRASSKTDVETAAFTIFPERLWRMAKGDRQLFYKLFADASLRYAALHPSGSRRGSYFSRLVAYHRDLRTGECLPHAESSVLPDPGNQLEFILTEFHKKPSIRRSMFQASVYDPSRDHISQPYLQFPCMQHITLVPSRNGTLGLNAFYATQQVLWKAYGNYLGLCRLGQFMAGQMGLRFSTLHCFVGIEKMEQPTGNRELVDAVVLAAEKIADTPA